MAAVRAVPRSSRVVYFGTPEVAVAPLRALCRAGHDVTLVVTRAPKRRGRRQEPTPSPVALAAAGMGLSVTCDLADAVSAEADVGVVVAYGEHIPDGVLQRRRTVNLHFSLLPRWRGAAPVERAILAGDAETGVCLMDVASEIDAGAVYRRASTAVAHDETAEELRARLCEMGIELLLGALDDGFGDPMPQQGEVIWAHKISPPELRIDWSASAEQILRLVRIGGAWTTHSGRRLKVHEARPAAEPHMSASGIPESPQPVSGSSVSAESVPDSSGAGQSARGRSVPDSSVMGESGSDRSGPAGTIVVRPRAGGGVVEVATGSEAVELVTVQSEGRSAVAAHDWANGARLVGGGRFDG